MQSRIQLALLATATPFASAQLTVRPIAELADQAPGQPDGIVLEAIANLPATETLLGGLLGPPARIDANGRVVFHAYFGDDGIPHDNPFSPAPSGIFAYENGVGRMLVQREDPAPGTDDIFIGFPGVFKATPLITASNIAFDAGIGDNFFAPTFGSWIERGDTINLVATEGDQLPGMLDADVIGAGATLVLGPDLFLFAEIDNGINDGRDFNAIWRIADTLQPLAVAGAQAPGFPDGVVFGPTDGQITHGTVGGIHAASDGRFAMTGFTDGPEITRANDEGIWIENNAKLQLVLREGAETPPGFFEPGSRFTANDTLSAAFSGGAPNPRINARNELIFFAQIDPANPENPRVPTLWKTTDAATPELIWRGRQRGVQNSVPGDPAPGVDDGFFFFPILVESNDLSHYALKAFVETNDDIFDDTIGIWVDRGNGLELVAVEEGPVPDLPGLFFIPETNGIRGIQEMIFEADGTVLYRGFFFDETDRISLGLFRSNPDGLQQLITRWRAEVDVDGQPRSIQAFHLAEGTSDEGDKLLRIHFQDGTTGVYAYSALRTCPADLTGDGVVDSNDFFTYLDAFATGNLTFCDLDDDDSCDADDFFTYLDLFAVGC